MRNALSTSLLAGSLLAGLLGLAGCSGGSSDDSSSLRIKCLNGQSFCLISCDLGCTQSGCSVTEIAENQRLRFKFSDRIDPATVNNASFSIRTATGVAPDGDLLVSENEITFAPKVRTTNGVSTFGFLRNESYIISLAGGEGVSQGVRSTAGDGLAQDFTCTVRASGGIQDEDQLPPTVELLSPADASAVSQNPVVVLRFSELIDTTALQAPLSVASPIRMVLRPTLLNGTCNRDAEGITLEGLPALSTEEVDGREVTVVTWQPPVQLPGLSCLTVYVSSDLRDLSGRAAIPAQFELITVPGTSTDITITEGFATPAQQEELVSGGVWSGDARPAVIGSDGRHGSFVPSIGVSQGAGVYVWSTLSQIIPASNTPSGNEFQVTDGRFFFTDFVLEEGVTLKFVGPVPPQIYVRGRAEIRGTIDVSAVDMPHSVPTSGPLAGQRQTTFNARGTPFSVIVDGQPGGLGGSGGGRGGNGGRDCAGTGPTIVNGVTLNHGQPGETVFVAASHAYAGQAGGTRGQGSEMNPPSGLTANAGAPFITGTSPAITFRDEFSRGGSGGGFVLAGALPILPTIPLSTLQPTSGPAPAASVAFPMTFNSPPVGSPSLVHYLVGGSGGGGGGCHTFGILSLTTTDIFMAGHGGSGGGGAVAVRAGSDLTVYGTARILARGGRGVVINGDNPNNTINEVDFGVSSPGGGGSGGSILLQSGRTVTVSGVLDTTGGEGSRTSSISISTAPTQLNVQSQGGAGSNGFYRLEGFTTVNFSAATGTVPTYDPTLNTGPLLDRDDTSGDLSKWYATNQVFPPTWLRYELKVDHDGDPQTPELVYTDRGLPGDVKANDPNGPVVIEFQGATLNQSGTAPLEGTIKPWREGIGNGSGPGIQQDSVTGFRFRMTYNRLGFPAQAITELKVFART